MAEVSDVVYVSVVHAEYVESAPYTIAQPAGVGCIQTC